MEITVQLFASLAEAAGTRTLQLDGLADPIRAGDLGEAVFARFPALAALRASVIYAVNEEYVQPDYPVRSGDTVALIPPVSGGAPQGSGEMIDLLRITDAALDIGAIHDAVLRPEAGAVSLFVGVVRNENLGRAVDYLVYDAYPVMAIKVMQRIAEEIRDLWPVRAVAMHHRRGRLEIGEVSVAIAVSAPHRKEAIDACRYAIDRLKAIVPIWKKEVWVDGEHWIEGSVVPGVDAKPPPDA